MTLAERIRDLIRTQRSLNIALPIAMVLLIAVALFSSWSIYLLREAIRYERQSNLVQSNVHGLYELIQGAESSQRGYLLTGKSEYLATYMTSFPEIPKALAQLKQSVLLLPEHEVPMQELDDLMSKKLDELKLTVVLQQAEKEDDALALIQTDRGEALMNRIHAVLDGLDRAARREALVHQTFVRRYASVLNLTIALGTAMTLLLVLLFAFLTSDEIQRRTRSEQELRAAQNAALVASKLKSQFLATVSHEIRTPLNGIIGMSDLLRARMKEPEQRRLTDIIHNSGHALLKIVNDILDFSKIEAGKIDFEYSEFSLLDSVEQTVELFSAQARDKKLGLSSAVDPITPARLVGDVSRISQILRNFISNAIKFTKDGGVNVRILCLEKSVEKTLIRIEVQDSGRGIPSQYHKLLFQPFNQVTDPNSKNEGTGLGLSICKDLTEAMGGRVGFESTPGKGSNFWCEIPLKVVGEKTVGTQGLIIRDYVLDAAHDSPAVTAAPVNPLAAKRDSALVLLVEDNQTNQLLAELLLQELGHRVHTVANGREALEALSRISYDLVLMDCQMPVMDGFEATRRIRAGEGETGKHVPIIAMTANALDADKEKCFAAGMDDFLAKPFQAADLNERLRRWIRVEARGSVDWAVLHDLSAKTNATVVSRLIQSFLKTLPASLTEIEQAKEKRDRDAMRAWAHQLKSSSASLGAFELNKLCQRLESSIETGSDAGIVDAAAADLLKTGAIVLGEFQTQTRYGR